MFVTVADVRLSDFYKGDEGPGEEGAPGQQVGIRPRGDKEELGAHLAHHEEKGEGERRGERRRRGGGRGGGERGEEK